MTNPTSNQCGVKGCKNTRDSGAFVGPFCAPCDHDLRTGNFEFGTSIVYEQAREIERAKRIMQRAISWLQIKEAAFTTHKGPAIIEEMQRYVGDLPDETECRLWTQAEWDLKNKQVDELEQEAMRLRVLLRRFMNCRSEPPGTGWKVAAGANAGDALNKVYLDAKKHFAGSPVEPTHCTDCGVALVPEARHFSGCKSHPGERAAKARTPLRDSDAAFNLGVLPTEQPEKASEMATVRAFGTTIDPENG